MSLIVKYISILSIYSYIVTGQSSELCFTVCTFFFYFSLNFDFLDVFLFCILFLALVINVNTTFMKAATVSGQYSSALTFQEPIQQVETISPSSTTYPWPDPADSHALIPQVPWIPGSCHSCYDVTR